MNFPNKRNIIIKTISFNISISPAILYKSRLEESTNFAE